MKSKISIRFFTMFLSVLFFLLYILLAITTSGKMQNEAIISTSPKSSKAELTAHENICFLSSQLSEMKSTNSSLTFKGKNGENISGYDSEDLFWLSRIIYAEAGTEPLEGKLAVGSVVMNRLESENYPNTVYGVIFDTKFGVQFTPAATGAVYKTPDSESILAAKMCLGGYSVSDDILFFLNEAIATGTWMQDNCDFVMSIGNHDFYS